MDTSRFQTIDRSKMPDAFAFLRLRADVRKCCGNPDNLRIFQEPNNIQLAICIKCGSRHRRIVAEPGVFSALFGDK